MGHIYLSHSHPIAIYACPIQCDVSHGIPTGMTFPWTSLRKRDHSCLQNMLADTFSPTGTGLIMFPNYSSADVCFYFCLTSFVWLSNENIFLMPNALHTTLPIVWF